MVIYHTAFDLSQFYGWNIDVFHGGWKILARSTAILFLLLVGCAAAISDARAKDRSRITRWKRHFRRFISIGAGAFAVSVVTYSTDPETYVRFGVLHLIAVGALVIPLVRRHAMASLPIGVAIVMLGLWTGTIQTDSAWLYILGSDNTIASVDYFPLVPWLGVMFVGYGVGFLLYVKGRLRVTSYELREGATRNFSFSQLAAFTWPGRHALLCYLLHQPLIIAVLWLVMGKPDF